MQCGWTSHNEKQVQKTENKLRSENDDLLDKVFSLLPLLIAFDINSQTNGLPLSLLPRGVDTRDMTKTDTIKYLGISCETGLVRLEFDLIRLSSVEVRGLLPLLSIWPVSFG